MNQTAEQIERRKKNGRRRSQRYRTRSKNNVELQIGNMLVRAKGRAAKKGLAFSLTRGDVVIPEFCPVLGTKLGFDGPFDSVPSLDRIVQDRGYIPENVVVVSTRANILKRDATIEELGKLWEFYQRFAENG